MMHRSSPPKIKKLSPVKQRRLDQLLQQNAQGTISAKDKAKLEALVAEAEELMVANSQRPNLPAPPAIGSPALP